MECHPPEEQHNNKQRAPTFYIMKKIAVLITVIAIAFSANAQLGNLLNAAARSAQKSIEKRMDKEIDTITNRAVNGAKSAILGKLGINQPSDKPSQSTSTTKTAKDFLAQMPTFPTDAQIADYACLMSQDNPSALKMMTNPVAIYLGKVTMMTTEASNSLNNMSEERAEQIANNYQKQIEEFYGVSAEELEKMSDEEIQELTYKRLYSDGAAEMVNKSAEMIEPVAAIMDQYTAIGDKVEAIFTKADQDCQRVWDSKYKKESQRCTYFKDAAAIYSTAVRQAMEIRRTEQMKIAEKMDKEIADYVAKNPNSNADQVSYTRLTMLEYLGDAARIASVYQPTIE